VPPSLNGHHRPTVLYLVHRLPFPPDKGDRIRAFQVLRYLSQKAAVHLACLSDEPIEPTRLDGLRRHCAKIAVIELGAFRWARALGSLARGRTVSEGAFSSPQLREVLRQWTATTSFDACLVSASSMVPYLRLAELKNVPAVVDLVDVDSEKWFDYASASAMPRRWLYRVEGRRLRKLEAKLPTWVNGVTLVSQAEARLYQSFCTNGQVAVIGNGVDLNHFHPQPQLDQQRCVFLGALDYRPNVDGIIWFCREVWPKVRQLLPHASVQLVGRRPVAAVQRLAQLGGVEVVGQVDDVRPYMARASVSIAPLLMARGVQNKILEAMAMGKASVVSPSCMKGIGAQPNCHLLVASTAEEWTRELVGLLQNHSRRIQLGNAAREYVMQHHRWDRCLAPLDTMLGLNPASVPLPHAPEANAGSPLAGFAGTKH
jgi:sugar transferase (PEP-CTERM/EpsH1 system associated)